MITVTTVIITKVQALNFFRFRRFSTTTFYFWKLSDELLQKTFKLNFTWKLECLLKTSTNNISRKVFPENFFK
jgi:hypothetical protein